MASATIKRCDWCGDDEQYVAYHDDEWGIPTVDDRVLFEKLSLEAFQCGLSWLTILRKRDRFRHCFANFDHEVVAGFREKDVKRLLGDAGIVRHRGKIEAVINNARLMPAMIDEFGSLAAFAWQFEPRAKKRRSMKDIPSTCDESVAMSKALKKRGWKFVGPTTMYAFMQAMGLVNDHIVSCCRYDDVEAMRKACKRPT